MVSMQNTSTHFIDEDPLAAGESVALKSIRQESVDIYNRLHSIAEDATFISRIIQSYPNFLVYPNLRCGAWYVDPKIAQSELVYFKSTDGHFGQWSFNLRRPNLHLLSTAAKSDGIILVDSTRRGKRLPDALSKTVPIWCAVINLAIARMSKTSTFTCLNKDPAENGLYTPPGAVSRSEHAQIESHLNAWATDLLSSEFSIPLLQKPLRPIWITPSTLTLPRLDSVDFFPVICLSASKFLSDGIERRSAGFVYVQGSGDDHESWSQGLTPQLFWQHKAQLISCTRHDLSTLIPLFVGGSAEGRRTGAEALSPSPVSYVNDRLAIGTIPTAASELKRNMTAYVLITSRPMPFSLQSSPNILLMESQTGKKGQYTLLTDVLPRSLEFMKHHLGLGKDVFILCETGKDISVGLAVAALTLFFDDQGICVAGTGTYQKPTKQMIHRRLQWVLSDNTHANPSRTTLKRVNEFLMSPPRMRHPGKDSTLGEQVHVDRKANSTPEAVL